LSSEARRPKQWPSLACSRRMYNNLGCIINIIIIIIIIVIIMIMIMIMTSKLDQAESGLPHVAEKCQQRRRRERHHDIA
jgi:uncharacterized protein YpmB